MPGGDELARAGEALEWGEGGVERGSQSGVVCLPCARSLDTVTRACLSF